jgi:hypothetical protein
MPTETRPASAPAAARSSKQKAGGFEELLARCGSKERASIEKHLAACDAEDPGHGALWRRLAGLLGSLAPAGVQTAGQHAIMFFVPDGKYRMQVFALEDLRDGTLKFYLPNILDKALRAKLLAKAGGEYVLPGPKKQVLPAEQMDAANTPEPLPHVKHMLGWNRKAIKLTLPAGEAKGPLVTTAEALSELAAKQWNAVAE